MKWTLALTLSWWCDLSQWGGQDGQDKAVTYYGQIVHPRPIHCNRMWLSTFYISNIGVRVFPKWSKATHYHIILTPFVPSWVLGFRYNSTKNSVIRQYNGFTTMTMFFYWLIILNNIILMIDNDQSTIIQAPEVYKSIPTHSPTAKPTT